MIPLLNFKSRSKLSLLHFVISLVLFTSLACESQNTPKKELTQNDPPLEVPKQEAILSIDNEAVDLLRQSLNFVGTLSSFSVKAQSTMEDLNQTGHRVDFEISSSIIINRPNKIWIERHGDLLNQIFYYNGKTLTLYNPVQNVYATEATPETIEEMFQFAYDNFGLSTPVSDLVFINAFDLLIKDVNHAEMIGKEMIGDIKCDHLLFSRPGVDFQIWIADDGSLLPYKYVVTDTTIPQLLAYSTVMKNWDLNIKVSEETFNFKAPEGTFKIDFLPVN